MINLFRKAGNYKFFFSKTKKLQQLLKSIRNQQGKNILESGNVASYSAQNQKIEIYLKLEKDYRKVKAYIQQQLIKQGYKQIDIKLAPKQKSSTSIKSNLKNVKKIIAVSSCKGGVGKSTIAVNIACTLKQLGYKVGIFDSDIYGPSLPTLINKQNQLLKNRQENVKQLEPILFDGIKCMSFGFVANHSAVARGPIISGIVANLLYQTYWGELDYLIIDMPPGTGDIQITLCQEVKFNGAVIITTPQRLAYVDVIKGIQLFQSMRVKILGIVQNMAYHICPKCKSQDLVFGRGYLNMLIDQFGIKNSVKIPIYSQISNLSDAGKPVVLNLPKQNTIFKIYRQLVQKMIPQSQTPYSTPIVHYSTTNRKVIIQAQSKKKQIDPYYLRLKCKCANCIHQLTGEKILKIEKIDKEVYPAKIQQKGNFAVAIFWSDGHRNSLYPYERLLSNQIQEAK